jgi:serine protease
MSRIFNRIVIPAGTISLVLGAASVTQAGMYLANPFSPTHNHKYRHGVVPTRETWNRMRAFRAANLAVAPVGPQTLSFGGGVNGIGVTSGVPKLYLVVYGSQWGSSMTDTNGNMTLSGDTKGELPRLQLLFKGIGKGGELWSGTMTQYCDGSLVAKGATSCPASASHVGFPSRGALAGVWYDNSVASPAAATGNQLATEAIKAAAHFGNTTAASNRYVQYVILSPSGTKPDDWDFTSQNGFCAWHDYNGDVNLFGGAATSDYGDIAFTNMPYLPDAGTSCGANFVNSAAAGALDGLTIVSGHEYAETLTDQNPPGGWINISGAKPDDGDEDGDECAWIASGGVGASANVIFGTGPFAMQSTWSNDSNTCAISHPIVK